MTKWVAQDKESGVWEDSIAGSVLDDENETDAAEVEVLRNAAPLLNAILGEEMFRLVEVE